MNFVKVFMLGIDAERFAHDLDWAWNVPACVSADHNLVCNLELFNEKFIVADDPSSYWRDFYVYANDPDNQVKAKYSEWPDLSPEKRYGLVVYYNDGGTPWVMETANNPEYLIDQCEDIALNCNWDIDNLLCISVVDFKADWNDDKRFIHTVER